MALPRGDEYSEAVQNPMLNFFDKELQTCKVETTHLGLPKPYSGGFTTTYKLQSKMNHWAVRCFTRDISDLRQRYKAIGNFQNKNHCEFLVEANFLRKGILVNNQYYSVIKMKWQEGYALNTYINAIYKQKKKVEIILNEFCMLMENLTNLGIAHGDLQHGNILIDNDKIYLIDYDGMYLPELSQLTVSELGHPNFQHPRRTEKDYNKFIDRFSAIIIYTALRAILVSPRLWSKFDNGDNLLFKADDFIHPQKSKLLKELSLFPDLKKLIKNLINITNSDFEDIPCLTDFQNLSISSPKQILPEITTARNAYKVINGTDLEHLLDHIGEKVEVIGKIEESYDGVTRFGPYVFLTIGKEENQTFTIVIWADGIASLARKNIEIHSLINQWISITGVLTLFLAKPQMILDSALQIHIFEEEKEARQILNSTPVEEMVHLIQVDPNLPKIKEEDITHYVQEVEKKENEANKELPKTEEIRDSDYLSKIKNFIKGSRK